MHQLILLFSTNWVDNQTGKAIGGISTQIINGDDVETLAEKAGIIVAQFATQGITVAWTIA